MGEIFHHWLENPNVAAKINGYGLGGASDEVQTALEVYVANPSGNNAKKLAKQLGKKPLQAKHIGNDIADIVRGLGKVGATDPFIADNPNEHYKAGR